MAAPDPMRVGGLAWTRQTKGNLTPGERRKLLGQVAAGFSVRTAALGLPGRWQLVLARKDTFIRAG